MQKCAQLNCLDPLLSMGVFGSEPPFSFWTLHAGSWQTSTSLQANLQSVSDFYQFKTGDFHCGIQRCIQSHSSRANTEKMATTQLFRDNTMHTLEIQPSCYSYSSLKLETYSGVTHCSLHQTCKEFSFKHFHSLGNHMVAPKSTTGHSAESHNELPGSTGWTRSGMKWCGHIWMKPKQTKNLQRDCAWRFCMSRGNWS